MILVLEAHTMRISMLMRWFEDKLRILSRSDISGEK